jgi:osmotically inducible protein OsmC
MKPNASATWVGGLKRGKGVVTTGSGTLSQSQFSGTGDEGGKGANPYELIAAALAACFSMTLANELVSEGFTPDSISTTATVTMEPLSGGWTITIPPVMFTELGSSIEQTGSEGKTSRMVVCSN